MIDAFQFLNGYGIVLIWGLLACLSLLLLVRRRSRMRWWAAWTAGIAGTLSGLFLLRTADSTVIAAVPTNDDDASGMTLVRDSLEWDSAESIEKAILASDGKPTLVEFYTDFGIG
ncbi:MAG TPA: hypothetical protein VKD71_12760 [Gemmataceae bacterium]|nr:hypothetical protein [Gemmataceae bacterium]